MTRLIAGASVGAVATAATAIVAARPGSDELAALTIASTPNVVVSAATTAHRAAPIWRLAEIRPRQRR